MKKKWLSGLNIVLGALSFGLLGCASKRIEAKYGPPEPIDMYGIPVDEVINNTEPEEQSEIAPADTMNAPINETKK